MKQTNLRLKKWLLLRSGLVIRLNTLKNLGITPFVQPYRDFENERKPTNYGKYIRLD